MLLQYGVVGEVKHEPWTQLLLMTSSDFVHGFKITCLCSSVAFFSFCNIDYSLACTAFPVKACIISFSIISYACVACQRLHLNAHLVTCRSKVQEAQFRGKKKYRFMDVSYAPWSHFWKTADPKTLCSNRLLEGVAVSLDSFKLTLSLTAWMKWMARGKSSPSEFPASKHQLHSWTLKRIGC